jgi:hypothetical protein
MAASVVSHQLGFVPPRALEGVPHPRAQVSDLGQVQLLLAGDLGQLGGNDGIKPEEEFLGRGREPDGLQTPLSLVGSKVAFLDLVGHQYSWNLLSSSDVGILSYTSVTNLLRLSDLARPMVAETAASNGRLR